MQSKTEMRGMATATEMDILIVHTWGIGDLIMLTPVLNVVHKLHPRVKIHFLFFPKAAAIPVINAQYVGKIRYSSWKAGELLKSIKELRKGQYHAAMFSSGVTPWKAWLFLLLLKTKKRIGEYKRFKYPFLDVQVRFDATKSRTENNYRLIRSVLEIPSWLNALAHREELNLYTQFNLQAGNRRWASEYLARMGFGSKKLVGIHPGCMAKNSYRRWDKDNFVALIGMIKAKFNYEILVIAGPDELDVGEYISDKSASKLLSKTPLTNVAAVIAQCDFFINTDSGLGHIASCFRVKSLTIFGPGDEAQTAPFSPESRVVRNHISCAPCVGRKRIACEVECLKELKPETVFMEFCRL
ncbi:MAG: glycosyltransferase family 9 protein [Candidatus Cloacimonetes bacterium]|nr:glycosyltransferase family 9 protein [Candidatus Cloacimonadota bacterium]MDD4232122.1 glycosyltransferase family 9 protein [Candidatus Cloacimonadota bacterium]